MGKVFLLEHFHTAVTLTMSRAARNDSQGKRPYKYPALPTGDARSRESALVEQVDLSIKISTLSTETTRVGASKGTIYFSHFSVPVYFLTTTLRSHAAISSRASFTSFLKRRANSRMRSDCRLSMASVGINLCQYQLLSPPTR